MIEHDVMTASAQDRRAPRHLPGRVPDTARTGVHSLLRLSGERLEQQDDAAWFEHDGVARFVLDPHGHILRSNAKARALAVSGILGSGDMFLCPTHRSRPEFEVLLSRLAEGRQVGGRILFRAGDDAWCLLDLCVLPGVEGRVFATVRQARPLDTERVEPLRAVFGLTRAETSVLSHLTCGDAPKEIGRKMDMSIHTVRAHLRAICMRMGVKGINGALRLSFQLTT